MKIIFHLKHNNDIYFVYIFRLTMDTKFTVESFSGYLKDLNSESSGSIFNLSKACAFGALRLQLDITPPSQKILDECLRIGLSYLHSQSPHIPHVVAALRLVLYFGAKWDGSTLFENQRTPYHIICQCSSDPYELLDKMIKSSGRRLVNEKDSSGCTAVMYAVHNKNVECLRCLITHGADLNLGSDLGCSNMRTPLIDAIRAHSSSPSPITRDILNLLLENRVDVDKPCHIGRSPIEYAIDQNSIDCVKKLVLNAAELDLMPMWLQTITEENFNMLGCLFDLGIIKEFTDSAGSGRNVLHRAICVGNFTMIRFLLEAGAPILTKRTRELRVPCCVRMTSYHMINVKQNSKQYNPCLQAISLENLDVVQLLESYEQETFQSIEALKCAVRKKSLKMVNYFLGKYKYPLNTEYVDIREGAHMDYYADGYHTIITEACQSRQLEMVALLMGYGADPFQKSVHKQYQSAFQIAINKNYNELVAHFIRSGVSLNCTLYDEHYGDVLPFEYAVIKDNKPAAEMLLHAGCSCGKFNLINTISRIIDINKVRCYVPTGPQKLMRELNVHENNVRPVHQLCRKWILNHLCPRADKKIFEVPLPPLVISKYLNMPEIDNVLNECKRDHVNRGALQKMLPLSRL